MLRQPHFDKNNLFLLIQEASTRLNFPLPQNYAAPSQLLPSSLILFASTLLSILLVEGCRFGCERVNKKQETKALKRIQDHSSPNFSSPSHSPRQYNALSPLLKNSLLSNFSNRSASDSKHPHPHYNSMKESASVVRSQCF